VISRWSKLQDKDSTLPRFGHADRIDIVEVNSSHALTISDDGIAIVKTARSSGTEAKLRNAICQPEHQS
jgi:hypothetical protein